MDLSDFCAFPDWTVRLLIFNGKMTSQTTYIDLMDFTFGRVGRISISIFSFIFAFGGTTELANVYA
jgi:hypothetical protein